MIPSVHEERESPANSEDIQELVKHFSHAGKRADKLTAEYDPVANERVYNHYTMDCPLCEGTGRYDERGDVICDDCGCVIGGASPMSVVASSKKESAENTFTYRR